MIDITEFLLDMLLLAILYFWDAAELFSNLMQSPYGRSRARWLKRICIRVRRAAEKLEDFLEACPVSSYPVIEASRRLLAAISVNFLLLGARVLELLARSRGYESGRRARFTGTDGDDAYGCATRRAFFKGEGGFGQVWRVGQSAMKEISFEDASGLEAILREYQLMRSLGKKCAYALPAEDIDIDFVAGNAWMQMHLCEGSARPLMDKMDVPGEELSEKWGLQIIIQVAKALKAVYGNQVCHFDLKPANILLTKFPGPGEDIQDATVKLSDFGLALDFQELEFVKVGGTPGFRAPEVELHQAAAKTGEVLTLPPVGPKADMYSLSRVLMVLVVGPVGSGKKSTEKAMKKWSKLSQPAQDVFQLLSSEHPAQRTTAEQFLNHNTLLSHPSLSQ